MEGGGALSCDAPHDLCDDFDGQAFPDVTRWTTTTVAPPATLARTESAPRSPPFALVAQSVAGGSGGRAASLERVFAGPSAGIRCDFAFRLDAISAAFDVRALVATLAMTPAAQSGFSTYVLELAVAERGVLSLAVRGEREGGGPPVDQVLTTAQAAVGTWTRIGINVTLGASSRFATFVEGAAASAKILEGPTSTLGQAFAIGLVDPSSAAVATVAFDDVVCDRR